MQCPARITFTLGPSKRFWVHRILLLRSEYKGFYFSPVYTILHSTDFQLWSEFKWFLFHRHTRFSKVLFCQGFLVTLRTLIWASAFVLLPWRMAVDRGVTVQTPNSHSWSERKSWFYRILFISHFSQTCMVLHNPESLLWSECIFHTGIQRLECLTFYSVSEYKDFIVTGSHSSVKSWLFCSVSECKDFIITGAHNLVKSWLFYSVSEYKDFIVSSIFVVDTQCFGT